MEPENSLKVQVGQALGGEEEFLSAENLCESANSSTFTVVAHHCSETVIALTASVVDHVLEVL